MRVEAGEDGAKSGEKRASNQLCWVDSDAVEVGRLCKFECRIERGSRPLFNILNRVLRRLGLGVFHFY
jgi:hypothetical protein